MLQACANQDFAADGGSGSYDAAVCSKLSRKLLYLKDLCRSKMEGSARKLSNQLIFYALLKSVFHNLPGGLPALLDAFSAKVTPAPPGLSENRRDSHRTECLRWRKYLLFEG